MRGFHSIGSAKLSFLVLFSLVLTATASASAADPSDPPIKKAIQSGAEFLRTVQVRQEEIGLIVYARIKAGVPADEKLNASHLNTIKARVKGDTYKPALHHVYEASVDLMALEAADPKKYLKEITVIANYIMKRQLASGCWDYPSATNAKGDTSISQYAILGLWAAMRAGVEVPLTVFDKAAAWHLGTQLKNGAFCYHPADEREPKHSMTVAGVSDVLVTRLFLYPGAGGVAGPKPAKKPKDDKKGEFKVLQQIDFEKKTEEDAKKVERKPGGGLKVPLAGLNKSADRGLVWMTANFKIEKPSGWPIYYLYGLERMCTLANVDKIGKHDWYAEGSKYLLAKQDFMGFWTGYSSPANCTAFAILFLSRATKKFVHHKPEKELLGAGVMNADRGSLLAEKLKKKRIDLPIDKLLRQLADPSKLKLIEETQIALVEKIQVGSREELIGQKQLVVKLAASTKVEVRRMAIWALGRCDDIRLSPIMLKGLQDPNLGVVIEARDALCCLSRRPLGFGLPADPRSKIPVTATEEERKAVIAKWRQQLVKRWHTWYLRVRPYDERDDLLEIKEKN